HNLPGSKFCRQCGKNLAPAAVAIPDTPPIDVPVVSTTPQVAPVVVEENPSGELPVSDAIADPDRMRKVATFLRDAQAQLDRGDFAAAAAAAEEAAAIHPHSIAVLSMRATLYERMGRFSDAVAVLDKLDAQAPLSKDMIGKRAILKAKANASSNAEPEQAPLIDKIKSIDRKIWIPAVAGLATVILISAIGAAIMNANRDNGAEKVIATDGTPAKPVWSTANAMQGTSQQQGVPQGQQQPTSIYAPPPVQRPLMPPPAGNRNDPFAPVTPRPSTTDSQPVPVPDTQGVNPGRILPDPSTVGSAAASGSGVFTPIPQANPRSGFPQPGASDTNRSAPIQAGPPSQGGGTPIQAGPPSGGNGGIVSPPSDKGQGNDQGYIRIELNPPKRGGKSGGSGSTSAGNTEPGALGKAVSLQRSGQYSGAIEQYRVALSDGADGGACYQGMGLCYDRIGDRSAARVNYRKAIAAYLQQTEGPQRRAAEQSIAACRAALEALGDG
ncbi:MAG: tetratricopeptide repeat protein, partial [Armatimonadaceae bacterium]